MSKSQRSASTDLRGAARLATDATAGLTDLVEAMHERIARIPGFDPRPLDGRTGGIAGLVYRTIRGVTHLVGGSMDALLAILAPALDTAGDTDDAPPPRREREAIVAALNGVLGDYLAATANPLATKMAFRRQARPLPMEPGALAGALPGAGARVLVLAHGLCMGDQQWLREGHDHGVALAQELGFTPVYLNYNSGLHISINGREFARQLESLRAAWPQPIERLVLLGHSMGGLVARSALHHAAVAGHTWPAALSDLVFLGSPHFGAPLERAGNWVDVLLGATPYTAPFARLGKVRSAGITDLRHGYLVDEDWVGRDRFARGADRRQPVPLPDTLPCFTAAATLGQQGGDLRDRLLGDGLVPLDSALGRHRDPARSLAFPEDHQWVGYGLGHLDLLNSPEVYAQLLGWLRR
jgi:hypothetical protein